MLLAHLASDAVLDAAYSWLCHRRNAYHFSPQGLRVAKATVQKFVERASRLYEREREEPDGPSLLGMYVRRWLGWANGGLSEPPAHPTMRVSLWLCPANLHPVPHRPEKKDGGTEDKDAGGRRDCCGVPDEPIAGEIIFARKRVSIRSYPKFAPKVVSIGLDPCETRFVSFGAINSIIVMTLSAEIRTCVS